MADEVEPNRISWKQIHEIPTSSTVSHFYESVQVWMDKPHVVNRRLSGSLVVKHAFLPPSNVDELFQIMSTSRLERSISLLADTIDELSTPVRQRHETPSEEEGKLVEIVLRRLLPRQMGKTEPLVELVMKDETNKEISFIPLFMEKCEKDISTTNDTKFELEMMAYRISYCLPSDGQTKILLQVSNSGFNSSVPEDKIGDGVVCPSVRWLREQLLPKLKKWAENPEKQSKGSLRLIPLERYTLLYQNLKEKYGYDLVKNWPESTDPQKFVYEDIAIATYLIILWEEEQDKQKLKEKQSFVDLGCGNGLLVYILNKEGYPGRGIDVRKRKIWEFYGPGINLEENPVDPTASEIFPDVDWLIGNHSDELTPWLPVIAARSSYKARYFVLPCCFYDFNCKFVRKSNKSSQYRGYLDFVHEVGVNCGFEVEEDMLRIPSTKRICQIGQCRTYSEEESSMMETKIKTMIHERGCDIDQGQCPQTVTTSNKSNPLRIMSEDGKTYHDTISQEEEMGICHETEGHSHSSCLESGKNTMTSGSPPSKRPALDDTGVQLEITGKVSSVFQPREQKIKVRNCSMLHRSLKEFIVNTVTTALLQKSMDTKMEDTLDCELVLTSKGKPVCTWNSGGQICLPEVAKLFDKDTLKKLKNECGGIQTLLRNHRNIFQVVGGVVQLRNWRQQLPGPKLTKNNGDPEFLKRRYEALRNTSTCWFHYNHPDGCVLTTEQCPYAHSQDELVARPSPEYLKSL